MSAIAGLWSMSGEQGVSHDLRCMVAAVAHRGPDGSASWGGAEEGVGLAHLLLRTSTAASAQTPALGHGTGALVITADARIDNRRDIADALDIPSVVARQLSDGELILRSYQRWGDECAERLIGDFAFAIWDGRQRRLFCARDHYGIKPLYYHHRSDQLFAFGSEIKALLAVPSVPRELNEVKIGDFLSWLPEDREITFYQGIQRLPAAHTLTVTMQGMTLRQYWSLDPQREIRFRSDDEYAEAFRGLFREAVRCRLPADARVGSSLSGGLDSSSIACAARDLLAERELLPLHTFSLRFPDSASADEASYIHAVLESGGFEPHDVDASALAPIGSLVHHLERLDEPPFSATSAFHVGLCAAAQQQGVRVMLDGMFGDSTISHGRWYLPELVRRGRWLKLAQIVRKHARVSDESSYWILRRRAVRPLLTPGQLRLWQRLRGQAKEALLPASTVNPEFSRHMGLQPRAQRMNRRHFVRRPTERQVHFLELTSGAFQRSAELLDVVAALFGVQLLFPLADRRLMEFCLALPPEQKLHEGWNRSILRRGTAGSLPNAVRLRTGKADLSPWYVDGLRRLESHRLGALEPALSAADDPIGRYIDLTAVRQAKRSFSAMGDLQSANLLWEPLILSSWFRRSKLNTSLGPTLTSEPGGATQLASDLTTDDPGCASAQAEPVATSRT